MALMISGTYVTYTIASNDTNAYIVDNGLPCAGVAIAMSQDIEVEAEEIQHVLSEEDKYLLAKIVMAEAEGEPEYGTKFLIIATVLNRVDSDKFPNTIREVILEEHDGVYQFSPIGNGRWDAVEPNEECWEAVEIMSEALDAGRDVSNGGVLYFENCNGSSWHSRNLEFLCSSGSMRFYR